MAPERRNSNGISLITGKRNTAPLRATKKRIALASHRRVQCRNTKSKTVPTWSAPKRTISKRTMRLHQPLSSRVFRIPRYTLLRVMRCSSNKMAPGANLRWNESASAALHTVSEDQLLKFFDKTKWVASLNSRKQILVRDTYALLKCIEPRHHL
ncbi:hypothetical protein Q1695_006169 [Nippostrongylus brasiliensis]|nr:hypothetical protein Q1695_006169 [Nippostrongylus brasiliensis]